jgi:hypothetical protein
MKEHWGVEAQLLSLEPYTSHKGGNGHSPLETRWGGELTAALDTAGLTRLCRQQITILSCINLKLITTLTELPVPAHHDYT